MGLLRWPGPLTRIFYFHFYEVSFCAKMRATFNNENRKSQKNKLDGKRGAMTYSAKKALSNSFKCAGALAGLLAATNTVAADFIFQVGLDAGGDTIATAYYDDGDNSNIKAGQLAQVSGGMHHTISDAVEAQTTIGWKFDYAGATNGDISFDRYPLEALMFHRADKLRVGGGVTLHLNPKLKGSGAAGNLGSVKFDNALGFVAQVDYLFSNEVAIGGRYVMIDYETEFGGVEIDANSIGIVLTYLP